MKKYLPHIAVAVICIILTWQVRSCIDPQPEPDYKPVMERLEHLEAAHLDSLKAILKEREAIRKDCTIITHRHERVRGNLTDARGDSLARAIIKAASEQGFR